MITDKLENAKLYYPLGERIKRALKYLEDTDLKNISEGRYEIDGENIYALVNIYSTKNQDDCSPEAHRKYTDIQYVVKGSELIGYSPLKSQTPITEYNEEKDFLLYKDTPSYFKLDEGMFSILFPGELHMPGIKMNDSAQVKKVVIKIKM